jgi:multidrug efflux system outer membrane protein
MIKVYTKNSGKYLRPVLFGLLLVLGGCMLGPNYQRADYSGPSKYRFDTTNTTQTVNLRWWELLDDPVLDTLISTALHENKDVLIAAARVETARINMGYVRADQWPAFSYAVGVNGSGVNANGSGTFTAYPQFSWEIGFWGKYRRMNEAAQADFLSSEYAKRMVQLGLVSSVASTYYTLLAGYKQLAIAEQTLITRDSALAIMQAKLDGGMISLMDFNQAKIQRDIAAVAVPTYKRVVALSENTLSFLLGHNPHNIQVTRSFDDCTYELDIPVGLPSELLERRPDVRMAEEVYHAQMAYIGVAEALRWPSLNLTGLAGASADLAAFNTMGLGWTAGASVLGPLFQFGKNKRRVEMARQTAEMAQHDYEKAIIMAFKDVEDALVNISTFREELKGQESRTKTAISSEELSYIRYNEGNTTYLEVLEQQRESFTAQLNLLNTRLNLLISYINLYQALGGGWLSPEEEQQYMEQQQNNTK